MGKCNEKGYPLESLLAFSGDERKSALAAWLESDCGLQPISLQAMAGDASFRRYFRIHTQTGSLVVMDAPPVQENCRSYVAVANALRSMGLNAPEIIAADLERGFLLITDFGDLTYLKTLNAQNADPLYQQALNALATLQSCRSVPDSSIPPFTRQVMWQEWAWHKEWFLEKLLGLQSAAEEKELDASYALIVESAATQPQVFMHRDYHSANLMVLPAQGVGILDFQDAFIGPLTYDLVSLLRDCYIDWPEERVHHWVLDYQKKLQQRGLLDVDPQVILRWFDWMGMQRHLKALLTFARKYVRDQQPQYLNYIPRTLKYLQNVSQRYPELSLLNKYLNTTVAKAVERGIPLCAPSS
jgi:N-acetylmuramate 1-kinase